MLLSADMSYVIGIELLGSRSYMCLGLEYLRLFSGIYADDAEYQNDPIYLRTRITVVYQLM